MEFQASGSAIHQHWIIQVWGDGFNPLEILWVHLICGELASARRKSHTFF